MKIGLVSSFALKTPPMKGGQLTYGGLERVVYEHAKGLSELGHDVTIVAAKGSKAPQGVKLVETVESWDSLNPAQQQQLGKQDGTDREWEGLKWRAHTWNGWRAHEESALETYRNTISDMDVVGDHSWSKFSWGTTKEEIVGTCHSIRSYGVKPPRTHPLLTGVSKGHARSMSRDLHIPVRTLWNPVDVDSYPLETLKTERILSLNRIMPQKGIHLFVNMAEKLRLKADIAGDDSMLVPDQGYVGMIKQKCAGSSVLTYHGLVNEQKRIQLLKDAKVVVCMKDVGYEEVFGLQAVEANACGTPVVALNSWGFTDTIENNKNGLVCDTPEQVGEAAQKIVDGTIKFDPRACRESAERFSTKNASKTYEQMFKVVKGGSRW